MKGPLMSCLQVRKGIQGPLARSLVRVQVVRDIERDEIELISKTLGCLPIAHVDNMKPEKLGSAALVEEVEVSAGGGGGAWGDAVNASQN